MKIALIQMDIAVGDPASNVEKARSLVKDARQSGARLAVLPELWASGYDLEAAAVHAAPLGRGAFAEAAAIAAEEQIYLCGSLLESHDGRVFNTQSLHSPRGEILASYRKIHLFGLMDEPSYLAAGSELASVEIEGISVGLSICYDLRFPELFRRYALEGVVLMLVSAEWPESRLDHWRTLLRSRAIENQCFIAACNRVGETRGTRFGGHSMIIDPWGDVLAEGDDQERVVTSAIDLARVAEIRGGYPFLSDRRDGIYSLP